MDQASTRPGLASRRSRGLGGPAGGSRSVTLPDGNQHSRLHVGSRLSGTNRVDVPARTGIRVSGGPGRNRPALGSRLIVERRRRLG